MSVANGKNGVRLLHTPQYHGYNVKFSPYDPNLLAVASGQNFGLSGNGCLFVFNLAAPDSGVLINLSWTDGLFDVTWSEETPNCLVTASGDTSLQLWDTTKPQSPTTVYKGHTKEVYTVEWNQMRGRPAFISASWDASIKLWDPSQSSCVSSLNGHEALVYQASWSPHLPGCVASVAGDGKLKIWNAFRSRGASMTILAHEGEVLCCDWCKYNQNIVATAATDGLLKGWDLRSTKTAAFVLQGHEYPIRRVKFSPFQETQLTTVSYDFTTRLWDHTAPSPCVQVHESHTEFVYGLDMSTHQEGLIADCAWDQTVALYNNALITENSLS
ncbi:unnamed protein product, partial [Meganyctiphanes norvegica]